MKNLKYIGIYDFRELAASDAKRAEPPVEGFTKTVWPRNGVKEVSDPAAEWILRDLGDEFKLVEETQQAAPATATAPASSKSASKPS